MPRFDDTFLEELRLRSDIEQIISAYVPLKRRGRNLVGLCPFHNEKTPSFTVYPDDANPHFHCFGCGAGGDVITFIRRIENLDYVEAVRFLCERCGMTLPQDGVDTSLAERRQRVYEMNKAAARFFHDMLLSPKGRAGLAYYKNARGFSDRTITRFGLGYAPDEWSALRDHLRALGYSYEEQYAANLINRREKVVNGEKQFRYYDSFRGRVIVPIIDVRGRVVAFGARVLDDSKPKYINTADTPVYKKSLGVFGLNLAKTTKEKNLILVEGYMDAISLHQAGFDNVIACLGTALTGEMARLLMRYTEEVLLSYDADEAGQKATQRAIEVFASVGAKVRVVKLSGGKDPDEILRNYGPERFRSLLGGASNDIEFALQKAKDGLLLDTPDGKLRYLNAAADILSRLSNGIAVDLYASQLSETLGVDKSAVLARIRDLRRRRQRTQEKQKMQAITQDYLRETSRRSIRTGSGTRALKAQERIVALLYANPDFMSLAGASLTAQDFTDPALQALYLRICELIGQNSSLDFSRFADLGDEEMSRLVALCGQETMQTGSKKEFTDCITVLKTQASERENVNAAALDGDDFRALFQKKS
ncbi:MAG: DNA primase [Clostridia bacterium]|nr:DNA primase [Clostridia bacterium]